MLKKLLHNRLRRVLSAEPMLQKISYGEWNNVYRISNNIVELIVVADIGPRVIRYSFVHDNNIFHEVPDDRGVGGGDKFRLYGGHRLWVWPEVDRTYFPDNRPVVISSHGRSTCFTAPVEDIFPSTRLQKEFELTLEDSDSQVTLIHRVTNHDEQPTDLAVWCPTMMRAGGRAILPLPPRSAMDKDHYQSVGPLTLWSFTDLADPRWMFGTEFIQLRHGSSPRGRFQEQMIGVYNPAGWGAYFCDGTLFVKRVPVFPGIYPDFGCNFEIFTNPQFLELESLAPIAHLGPGESCCHTEMWKLFRNVPAGEGDDWIRGSVVPLAYNGRASS